MRIAAEHVAEPDDDEVDATDQFGEPLAPTGVDLDGWEPRVIASFTDRPELPTVLDRGPFGDEIKASLIWFPLDELRLSWEVLLTLGDYEEQYRTIVDAQTGEVLFAKQLVHTALARANVYRVDGSRPRELVDFPLALAEHGLPVAQLPDGFPDPWVEADKAEGNAVFAHLERRRADLAGDAVERASSSSTRRTRPATSRRS